MGRDWKFPLSFFSRISTRLPNSVNLSFNRNFTPLLGSLIQCCCKSSANLGKICRMVIQNQKTLVG